MLLNQKVNISNTSSINNKDDEKNIIDSICREEFYKWMSENDYTDPELKEIFNSKRISAYEMNRFNATLRRMKEETGIGLIEVILYFEEEFIKIKKILSVLDDDTKLLLKKELGAKYKIKIETNDLSSILED